MHSDITQILTDLVNRTLPLGQIRFSALAEQHPRTSPCLGITLGTPCEAFFSFFGQITHPAPHVLSIHFGKQQLTIELQRDNVLLQQLQVARRGPRTGAFLLQTLTELQMQPEEQDTARLVVLSLLSTAGICLAVKFTPTAAAGHCSKPFGAISKKIMPLC